MLKPERICSLFPARRSTRMRSVSSARALWLAKERAAPPLPCRKYKVVPSAEICGEKAYPSEEIWRSPFASCIHTVPCALSTEVISDLPSGAIAIPSSSVGPEDTLGNPVWVSHSPDVETYAAGIRREINPLSIRRPSRRRAVTVGTNRSSGRAAIQRQQPAAQPFRRAHLDCDYRLSIWRNVGAVCHAQFFSR